MSWSIGLLEVWPVRMRTFDRVQRLVGLVPGRWRDQVDAAVLGPLMRAVPDRRHLERVVLPAVAAARYRRVLFVGVSRVPDTRDYPTRFGLGRTEFWTLDADPSAAAWGGPRHRTGDVRDLGLLFPPEHFGAVLLNGVFGWGVDTPADQDAAVRQCRLASEAGGLLVVGWNTGRCADPATLPALRAGYRPVPLAGWPPRVTFPNATDHVLDTYAAR